MSIGLDLLAAAVKDRYAVQREIGTGGMATVYLAQDLRHHRSVALKVVRPDLAGQLGIERFLREIELAAGLQHPHILPVFDSGTVDDGAGGQVPYFVMPFVEGETLRRRLEREHRLPMEDAVALAREVADALAYAHAHGVVHRDIKPENILLSGGHAVVADFGVAKALQSGVSPDTPVGDAGRLTMVGIAVGTPHYMSPEQATGRDVVDARSDQYSLGSVLYEMITGEPPFQGATSQSVIGQSMTAPRPRASRARADAPQALDEVIVRALALDPAKRYPDMAAFGAALRQAQSPRRSVTPRAAIAASVAVIAAALAGGWFASRSSGRPVAAAAETIAVLPFSASGPGAELLGEGMVDVLSTNLQGVGGIRTIDPRTIVKRWTPARAAGGLEQALTLGRNLGAGSVVLGSAVSTGSRMRLAADLYSVAGDRLGRAQVDGSADSVLPLVDRLSVALLRDVWRSREPLPSVKIASLTTDSLEALRDYLQGERYYRRAAFDSALAAYTRAVEVDSTFALAHLRRALAIGWTDGYRSEKSLEASAAALRFGQRLLPRDRRLLAGYQAFAEGQPRAIDSLRAFVKNYPDDLEGWQLLGEALYHLGAFRPSPPDTIMEPFERVLRSDSTLVPAMIHPIEVSLNYRDSVRFTRYARLFARYGPADESAAMRTAAAAEWGPPPSDSALAAAMNAYPLPVFLALHSAYRSESATSDSVLRGFGRLAGLAKAAGFRKQGLADKVLQLAGFGRVEEARRLTDTLARLTPEAAVGNLGWPVALELAPLSYLGKELDSLIAHLPTPSRVAFASAIRDLIQGRVEQGRRRISAGLASRDTTADSTVVRGLLTATRGWASLLSGDTALGIRQLREGLDLAASPQSIDDTSFLRFQLALALSARPDTRAEGITRLRYGFDQERSSYLIPLTYLALGRAWEAAGQRDSAAYAYGRFVRLWDKADPPLQGRVREAREALARLSAEPVTP